MSPDSESLPILMRDGALVLTALQLIRRQLPFPGTYQQSCPLGALG
jgi:hypothetical protein